MASSCLCHGCALVSPMQIFKDMGLQTSEWTHTFYIGAVSVPKCPKLRVHPAPGVHISTTGCTILGGVHPVCARFFCHLLLLYIGRVHGAISGYTVLWEVHPASAQNKSLISDYFGHWSLYGNNRDGYSV